MKKLEGFMTFLYILIGAELITQGISIYTDIRDGLNFFDNIVHIIVVSALCIGLLKMINYIGNVESEVKREVKRLRYEIQDLKKK